MIPSSFAYVLLIDTPQELSSAATSEQGVQLSEGVYAEET
jgi:hypothetical protein